MIGNHVTPEARDVVIEQAAMNDRCRAEGAERADGERDLTDNIVLGLN